jgi:hypothetical protein
MNDFETAEIERLLRDAGAAPRGSRGLRERSIARAVAVRSRAERETRFGRGLACFGLSLLLAMTVWKHASFAGGVPAAIGLPAAAVEWIDPGDADVDSSESIAANDDRREWKDVKRTTQRQRRISRLLASCFGS